jgi:hypothetical protein
MGLDPEDLSEDITICAPGAVMRLPCLDVRAVVRWHAQRRERAAAVEPRVWINGAPAK